MGFRMRYRQEGGFSELNSFPGCNQLVISNHSFVFPHLRGLGIGNKNHVVRLKLMEELGYDYALCTVIETNEAQIRILSNNNWTLLDKFYNKETGNIIRIYGRSIGDQQ